MVRYRTMNGIAACFIAARSIWVVGQSHNPLYAREVRGFCPVASLKSLPLMTNTNAFIALTFPPPHPSLSPNLWVTFTHKWGYWTQGYWKCLRGRGGLFQNRETKETLHGDQLSLMGEAGGELPGNSHPNPCMEMTDETSPPAFAAPFLRSHSSSLFVSSF
jgi:hypothetical protein